MSHVTMVWWVGLLVGWGGFMLVIIFFALRPSFRRSKKVEENIKRAENLLAQEDKQELAPLPLKYIPVISDKIEINIGELSGLLAIRVWSIPSSTLELYSRNIKMRWNEKEIISDQLPLRDNSNGIYAYRLGVFPTYTPVHIGFVELSGKFIEHRDGIIRAEKCRVLTLVGEFSKEEAQKISSMYGFPVVLTNDCVSFFSQWLMNEGGKFLEYNKNLLSSLEKPKQYNILDEVNEMLEVN